jgi:hypothetical protein
MKKYAIKKINFIVLVKVCSVKVRIIMAKALFLNYSALYRTAHAMIRGKLAVRFC